MRLPKLTDLVKANRYVRFAFYRDGELWYEAGYDDYGDLIDGGFQYPIPPDDMKGAIFPAEDKSVFHMRFIRKHLEFLAESMKAEGQLKEEK